MKISELNTMVDSYLDGIVNENSYQDFFKGMLKKYGVKSPMQLPPDKKAKFYTDVKAGWSKQKNK